jgi:hypothetical protein
MGNNYNVPGARKRFSQERFGQPGSSGRPNDAAEIFTIHVRIKTRAAASGRFLSAAAV